MLKPVAAIPFLSASWHFSKRRGTTSAIEEFPRVFSRQSKVPWDTAQQLYDVGYVVYKGEKKGYGNGRGKGKEGVKEGETEISKNSEIDSNQQCLQHTHAEASGTGRPQAPSGALTVMDTSTSQATQHRKQLSIEMARFTDGVQAQIPWVSAQLPNRRGKQAADQWAKGTQRPGLCTACPPRPLGRGLWAAGGRALQEALPIPRH